MRTDYRSHNMDIFEQKTVLDSFKILHDSREQETERAKRRYNAFGCQHQKATLSYGDYTYNATLPDGTLIYDTETTIKASVIIERKMNADELIMCLTSERERFEREFKRAQENDAKIYLLIEDCTWERLAGGRYRSKMHPNAVIGSLMTYTVRYGVNILMCDELTTPRIIKEILYRELKERLERGQYG